MNTNKIVVWVEAVAQGPILVVVVATATTVKVDITRDTHLGAEEEGQLAMVQR